MDNILLWVFLGSLAVYRCTSIVSSELGPFRIFERIRVWTREHAFWLWGGITCFMCLSVWFGFFFSALIATSFKEWLIVSFAMSALSIFFYMADALMSKHI